MRIRRGLAHQGALGVLRVGRGPACEALGPSLALGPHQLPPPWLERLWEGPSDPTLHVYSGNGVEGTITGTCRHMETRLFI